MTSESDVARVSRADAEKIMEHHLHLLGEGRSKRRRKTLQRFLIGLSNNEGNDDGFLEIDQAHVLECMIRDVAGQSLMNARRRLGMISRFVRELERIGLISVDPIEEFRSGLRHRGWKHLVPALQSADPHSELASLRHDVRLPAPLLEWIRRYLRFQRALGKKYYHDQLDLRNLDNFLQAEGVRSPHLVTSQLIEAWYDSQPGVWRTRHEKICGVNRFFKYLQEMEVIAANPVPSTLLETRRGVPRLYPPYIFTIEQISAILAELRRQPTDGFTPWHAQTCHTMAALQYALGLRHGELRRLRVRDVDFSRKTLFIDRTKFYKSRCLPFGPRVEQLLQEFMEVRRGILVPIRDDHPLFVAWWRTPLCISVYNEAFQLALKTLKITGPQGRPPRTHDLRHSFAVHRLSRWYRDGADVQSRLPWLSTFLGHVDIQSTQVYLTITADLYAQASERFYRCFGHDLEIGGGDA